MYSKLVAWLNGKRNYSEGVALYKALIADAGKLQQLAQGQNRNTSQLLFNELRAYYYQLKTKPHTLVPVPKVTPVPVTTTSTPLTPLAKACKLEADKLYKEAMNIRARLFNMCSIDPDAGENDSNAIILRQTLVLQLLKLLPEMHLKYEAYNHVLEHGCLPAAPTTPPELPSNPVLLERMRVNLMTGIAKLKKKEMTPERLDLLQRNQQKLEKVRHELSKIQ